MSRIDISNREMARLRDAEATLGKDIARTEQAAAKARAESARKRASAMKTRSLSSRQSYLRSAEAEEKKVVAAEKKLADLRKRSAQNAAAQTARARSLRSAEKSEREAQDRADHRRRQVERSHAKDIARLSRPTLKLVMVREPQPEKLRVLYLTANPEAIEQEFHNPDGSVVKESAWLRTEAEVRSVKQALRASRYRELVDFDHRSAATYEDLVDGINDLRPHIVHFSGHGGSKGLLFDNGSVDAPEGHALSFSILAETLAATDEPPTLLVLNACDTLEGSDAILPAVPVIIAMSDSIADTAAALFATRFYAAVAAAQSVGSSLRQATAAMRAALLEDADLPQISVRDGIDVDQLVLVKVARAKADFEEQPHGAIRVSGPVTDLVGGLSELITTLIELGPEGEEAIAKYSRRRQSRSAAHSLDGLSFAPHGFRQYLERIAAGEATLEDLHGIRIRLDSTAESVEFHLDHLSAYREKLREARGMAAAEKLDTIMYDRFGKDRLRRMLFELARTHDNTDPRSDATVARAKEILAAVKHLNAQIAELHDMILEPSQQAD